MVYYKEVEFDFPLIDDKNVTIIYAPNDTGKSCFFKGFLFTLYGLDKSDLKELINVNAFNEGDYKAYVSLMGIHNNKPIEIVRKIVLKGEEVSGIPKKTDFQEHLEIWENGNELVEDNFETKYDYINSIVHEEAAKYFFFDGEKIEAYNIASAADYKEAIMRILGLTEIENAWDDFEKIRNEYEKERNKYLEEQKEASKVLEAKKEIENKLELYHKDLEDYENELKQIKSRIAKHEEDLKSHETIKGQIEEKQKLRTEEEDLINSIKLVEQKKVDIFKQNSTIILGCMMADNIRRNQVDLDDHNIKLTLTKELNNFLKELASGSECVCGNSLNEKEIEKINHFISVHAIENELLQREAEKKQAFREIDAYIQFAANAKKDYLDSCKEKVRQNKRLNDVQERLFELKTQIGSYSDDAGEKITNDLTDLEQRKDEVGRKIVEGTTKIKMKEEERDDKERELSKFSNTDSRVSVVEKKLRLSEKIRNTFADYLEELTRTKKAEVQEKASKIFLQLTNKSNKYKGLHITDDYTLKLELSDGTQYEIIQGRSLNPSTGQSKIISLAYIAGINQSSNSIAPIVIDNPVGLFSEEHRMRVMEYLPKFGLQVIFMVTKADLSEEYKRIIQPYVNCEYYLKDTSDSTWNKTIIEDKVVCYG